MGKSARNADSVNRLDALTVATVAEAKALDVPVGTVVETQGYYSSGDGGANRYVVVAGGAGTDDGGSFIDMNNGNVQLQGLFTVGVFVDQFGAVGNGVVNDKAAIQLAWSFSKNLSFGKKTYYAPQLQLAGAQIYDRKVIKGNGATITGDEIFINGLFDAQLSDITFNPSVTTYVEGLRYCKLNCVEFLNRVSFGKYNTNITVTSWSIYWNEFNQCKINGGNLTTSITDANFNSNTFSATEFRKGAETSLLTFFKTVNDDGVFASNTFTGCDFSYAPVLNIVDDYEAFAMTVIGGYLDTGTPWYQASSFKAQSLDIIGLRNPSGVVTEKSPKANLMLTSGGARRKTSIPASPINLLLTEQIPKKNNGPFTSTVDSAPLPFTGEYSISAYFVQNGTPWEALGFENLTQATARVLGILEEDGFSSFTFSANAGDVIRLTLDGDTNTDTDIEYLACTLGCGVYGAVPYRDLTPYDVSSHTLSNGVSQSVFTKDYLMETSQLTFFKIVAVTNNPVAGGGGEIIEYVLAGSKAGSSVGLTLNEVSRTSVNGPGGTSDDSGTTTLTVSSSGFDATISAQLTGNPASVDLDLRFYPINELIS